MSPPAPSLPGQSCSLPGPMDVSTPTHLQCPGPRLIHLFLQVAVCAGAALTPSQHDPGGLGATKAMCVGLQ